MLGEPRIPSKLDNYEDTGERLGFIDKRDYSSPAKEGSRRRDASKFSAERSNSNKSRLPNLQSESPTAFNLNFQNQVNQIQNSNEMQNVHLNDQLRKL